MDISPYLVPAASFVIVVVGGAIIKLFIDRAFKGVDENIKELKVSLDQVDADMDKIWEYLNKFHEDVIRLQVSSSDTSKVSDLKAEFLEKFQTIKVAESDFDMLLNAMNILTAKFEKLEEKSTKYFARLRDADDT